MSVWNRCEYGNCKRVDILLMDYMHDPFFGAPLHQVEWCGSMGTWHDKPTECFVMSSARGYVFVIRHVCLEIGSDPLLPALDWSRLRLFDVSISRSSSFFQPGSHPTRRTHWTMMRGVSYRLTEVIVSFDRCLMASKLVVYPSLMSWG